MTASLGLVLEGPVVVIWMKHVEFALAGSCGPQACAKGPADGCPAAPAGPGLEYRFFQHFSVANSVANSLVLLFSSNLTVNSAVVGSLFLMLLSRLCGLLAAIVFKAAVRRYGAASFYPLSRSRRVGKGCTLEGTCNTCSPLHKLV